MDKTKTSLILALIASFTVIGTMAIFDNDTPVFKCEDRELVMPCESLSKYYGLVNGKCNNQELGNKLCRSGWEPFIVPEEPKVPTKAKEYLCNEQGCKPK